MVRSASSLRDIRQDNRGSLHQANSRQLEGLKNVLQELKSFDSLVRSCCLSTVFLTNSSPCRVLSLVSVVSALKLVLF